MSLTTIGIGKLVASIAVLGAAGFGGYNYMTSGCILGACSTGNAAVTEVSMAPEATEDQACALACSGEATTQLVAAKSDCAQMACATEKPCAEAAATLVAATSDCAEKACATEKPCAETAASLVANTEKKADNCCGGSECGQDCGENGCGGACPAQVAAKPAQPGNG